MRAPRQSHQVVQSMQQLSVFSRRLSDGRIDGWCLVAVCAWRLMVRFWCVSCLAMIAGDDWFPPVIWR